MASQQTITVSGWTGVGYILLDPETGTGAYKISGGANGAGFVSAILVVLMIMAFVSVGLAMGISWMAATMLVFT